MDSYLDLIEQLTKELQDAAELLSDHGRLSNIRLSLWQIRDHVADIRKDLFKIRRDN